MNNKVPHVFLKRKPLLYTIINILPSEEVFLSAEWEFFAGSATELEIEGYIYLPCAGISFEIKDTVEYHIPVPAYIEN